MNDIHFAGFLVASGSHSCRHQLVDADGADRQINKSASDRQNDDRRNGEVCERWFSDGRDGPAAVRAKSR